MAVYRDVTGAELADLDADLVWPAWVCDGPVVAGAGEAGELEAN